MIPRANVTAWHKRFTLPGLEVLPEHALPAAADVTLGFIRSSLEHPSARVVRFAGFLVERMG